MSFRSKYDPGVSFHASQFPDWTVYFGLAIVSFLLYVVLKNNKPKNKK
jgi:hypothetical protein